MADLGTINEGGSALYLALLADEWGVVIDMTALDSLTLTLFDPDTGAIVNTRDAQNVKGANGVSIYATPQTVIIDGVTKTYNLAWQIAPADNVILHDRALERRAGLFVAKWASSAKVCPHPITWLVKNLAKMP